MTAKQLENRIRIVVVAAVAKEFRRSRIIEKIVNRAKADGAVATGALISPEKSKSILPYRDDQWLTKKGAVQVRVGTMIHDTPEYIDIRVNLEYGIDSKYETLRDDRTRTGGLPNIGDIKKWIVAKSKRGVAFTYKNGRLDLSNDKHLTTVAFLISKGIKKDGIKNRSAFYRSFKNSRTGVVATAQRGLARSEERIVELYNPLFIDALSDILEQYIA